jgi:hypothetical protein
VPELAHQQLSAWESFYVIVGSSSAALIGLQFVVITLIADMRWGANAESIRAFGTPTVVHFGSALVVSAILSAPWPSLLPASIGLGVCGCGGLAYCAATIQRARRQTVYQPVWEDWLFYAFVPFVLYAVLAAAAFYLRTVTQSDLFVVAAVALGLLLLGIRNAWDTVTHIVISSRTAERDG